MTNKSDRTNPQSGISRRTVVAGTAWAVPAIVVASAAPAMAASGPVVLTGRACKGPGNGANTKDYYLEVILNNTSSTSLKQFCFTSIVLIGATIPLNPPQCYNVGAGTEQTVTITINNRPDSANGSATLNYTIDGNPGTTSATYTSFPPLGGDPKCYLN